jgi:hypothetical protein
LIATRLKSVSFAKVLADLLDFKNSRGLVLYDVMHTVVLLDFLQNLTTNTQTLAIYFAFTAAFMSLVVVYAYTSHADIVQTSRWAKFFARPLLRLVS